MSALHRFACATAIVLCSALGQGCLVVSLEPAYDDQSIVFDEGLIGTWQTADGATAVVERGEWHAYRIAYTSRSESHSLIGYETKIGDRTFIDLTPAKGLEAGPLMIPAHGLAAIERAGDSLTFAPLDYEWFTAAGRKHVLNKLQYTFESRKNLVLVSGTEELRAWLQANAKTTDMFREPLTFTRKQQ